MKDFTDFIEETAETTEFSEDEVRAKVEKAKSDVKRDYADKSEEFKNDQVVLNVSRYLQGASNLTTKVIDVVRVTGQQDAIEISRQRAIDMFDRNPQQAIDEGYTNRNGEPVWRGGPNEGEPMPEHIYQKHIYGVDSEDSLVQVTGREDLYKIIDQVDEETRIKVGLRKGNFNEEDKLHRWKLSTYSDPIKEKDLSPEEIVESLKNTGAYTDISDIRNRVTAEGYPPVVTKGYADRIQRDVPEGQSKRITLVPPKRDERITIWVDVEEEIPFEENSLFWLGSSMKMGEKFREDMEKDPIQTATVYFFYPDPGGTITQEDAEEEEEEDITL